MEAEKPSERSSGRVILVGIAGTTRSGKSTLSLRLQENFPHSIILHADRHWKIVKPFHEEAGFPNWECPEAVDYDTLEKFIDESVNKAAQIASQHALDRIFVFVEGFLLFANEKIRRRFDFEVFLTISKRSCWTRRQTTKPVPSRYFDLLLWPSFVKYNAFEYLLGSSGEEPPRAATKLLLLDSDSMDADTIFKSTLAFLDGKDVESCTEIHRRNLADTTDLSRDYAYYDAIHDVMTPEESSLEEPIESIIARRKAQLEAARPPRVTKPTPPAQPESSCVIL